MVRSGYKETDAGIIPEDWDARLVGDNLDFKNGLNKAKAYFGHGTPIINYMDVFGNSGLQASDVAGLVSVTSEEQSAYSARKGDLFFTRTSETVDEIGMSAVLLEDLDNAVFSGFVLRGRDKQSASALHIGFKKYCFHSPVVRKQIRSTASYTTRALTNGKLLSKVFVPTPSDPEEQKAIAEALSDVDGLIEGLEALIAKKRDLKTATMQQLLTGKTRLSGFGEGVGMKQTELGEIPEDWEVAPLVSKADFVHGKAHEQFIVEDGPYVVVNSKFVSTNGNVRKLSSVSHCTARVGDVLMVLSDLPNGKALSKCYLITEENRFAVNQRVCIFRGKTAAPGYLFYVLNRNKYFLALDDGVSQTHILNDDVRRCVVQFPSSLEEQECIAAVLLDMDSDVAGLEDKLSKSKALKQGMMQELLTGRTRLI